MFEYAQGYFKRVNNSTAQMLKYPSFNNQLTTKFKLPLEKTVATDKTHAPHWVFKPRDVYKHLVDSDVVEVETLGEGLLQALGGIISNRKSKALKIKKMAWE